MKDLTKGNIYKTFILFAVPMVLAGVLSQGYSIIDTIIAGRYLGDKGLAEVGASAAFISFVSSVFWGYGTGFAMYAARLFGAEDYKALKQAVYNNILLIMVASIIVSTVIVAFRSQIVTLLKADDSIKSGAALYVSIYVGGLFFIIMNVFFSYLLNALGSSRFPFVISILSAILNIGGNVLSVTVLDWGVAGIAAASVFAAIVSDIMYVIKLRQCFRLLGVNKHRVRFDTRQLKISFLYAMPVSLQQVLMYTSTVLISPMINGLGSAATAGYNVIIKIYDINANIYQNSAKTLSNYTAQCIGAGKQKDIKRGVRVGFMQGVMFLLPVLVACVVFAEEICGAFFSADSEKTALLYSVSFVRFYLPFIVFNVINNLFHAFFRGTGSMRLLVSCTTLGSVARLVYTFMLVGTYGMKGVFLGWVLSWITEAVFVIVIYLSGIWKKDCVKN